MLSIDENQVILKIPEVESLSSIRIKTMMATLHNRELVKIKGGQFEMDHHVFLALGEDDLALLDAPSLYPFKILLDYKGDFTNPGFRYLIKYIGPDNKPFVNPKRIGCLLKIGSKNYILHLDQYKLVIEIEKYNSTEIPSTSSKSEILYNQLRPFAKIKEIAEEAECSLSNYLKSQNVIVPNSIEPQIEILQEGGIKIVPRLGTVISKEDNTEVFETVLSDEEDQNKYLKQFENSQSSRKMYTIRKKDSHPTRVLSTPEIRKGLEEIKNVDKLSPEEANDFMDNPHQYLTSKVFYLAEFSDRVIEMAELNFITNIGITKGRLKIDWDNLIIQIGDPTEVAQPNKIRINSLSDLKQLKRAYQRALDNDRNYMVYKGAVIQRDDESIKRIIEGVEDIFIMDDCMPGNKSNAALRALNNGLDKESKSLGLKIKDNLEKLEYINQSEINTEQLFKPSLPKSIVHDINLYDFQKEGIFWL